MPNYDYMCGGCNHSFEEFLLMKDRKKPCKKPCPKCGKKEIKQYIASAPVVIDRFVWELPVLIVDSKKLFPKSKRHILDTE